MKKILHLGIQESAASKKSHFYIYSIIYGDVDATGYTMGLEVLYTPGDKQVMATLFHWPEGQTGKTLFHFANDEEGIPFCKLYKSTKGIYFLYKGIRVYIPSPPQT